MVLDSGSKSPEWSRRVTPLSVLKKVKKPTTYSKQVKRRRVHKEDQPADQVDSSETSHSTSVGLASRSGRSGSSPDPRRDRDAFDVPSSDEEPNTNFTPPARPPKKQKLSVPSASRPLPRLSNVSANGGSETSKVSGTGSSTKQAGILVAPSSNEFDVPDSDEDHKASSKTPLVSRIRTASQKSKSLGTVISHDSKHHTADEHGHSLLGSKSNLAERSSYLTSSRQNTEDHIRRQEEEFVPTSRALGEVKNIACTSNEDFEVKFTVLKPFVPEQAGLQKPIASSMTSNQTRKNQLAPHRKQRTEKNFALPSDSEDFETHPEETIKDSESITPGTLDFGGLYLGVAQTRSQTPPPVKSLSRANIQNFETPGKRKLKDRLTRLTSSSGASNSSSDREDDETIPTGQRHTPDASHKMQGGSADYDSLQMSVPSTAQTASMSTQTPGRGKVTYGRQRSHLVEQEEEIDPLLDSSMVDLSESSTPFRRKLNYVEAERTESSTFADEEFESDAEGLDKPLRNVHELRAAGKMRRAAFESDALLEDVITADSSSLRRGAVFRLCGKLLTRDFREDFVRSGQLHKFFQIADHRLDQFGNAALFMASSTILPYTPVSDLMPGSSASAVIHLCTQSLKSQLPLVPASKARSANMSKIHQLDFQNLCLDYIRFENWSSTSCSLFSGRIFAMRCLDAGISRLRQAGFSGGAAEKYLMSELASIASAAAASNYSDTTAVQLELSLSLSILESLSVTLISDKANSSNLPEDTLKEIVKLVLAISPQDKTGNSNMSLILRLCLNITTNSGHNARHLAQSNVIAATSEIVVKGFQLLDNELHSEHRDSLIDNMVLSLGFLTNVAEDIDENRILFLDTGPEGTSCLEKLLDIFHQKYEGASTATTEFESKISVTFGYTAVLICCLSLNNVIRGVVGDSFHDGKLAKVRNAMAQFILFYRTIGAVEDTRSTSGSNQHLSFVERMEEILRNLTTMCRQ